MRPPRNRIELDEAIDRKRDWVEKLSAKLSQALRELSDLEDERHQQ